MVYRWCVCVCVWLMFGGRREEREGQRDEREKRGGQRERREREGQRERGER